MSKNVYRLGRLLGAGGMAEVYFGQAEGVDGFAVPVAIKRVREAHAADPEFLAAFREEANLAARLAHPNIVRVLDFQHDAKGLPFIVMEHVDGADLSALARGEALPCAAAVYIIGELLRALAYAHDLPVTAGVRGVVHRDVSPQNILLSWHGEVKVSDFGIAKAFSTSVMAHSTTVRGKPQYMSPEQVNAQPLDGRSDLFSAGVVFWELLTGQPLFAMATYHETLARVLLAEIPRPSDVAPVAIPGDVEAVVLRLLERDRSARYQTALEAIADLTACEAASRDGARGLAELLAARCERPRHVPPAFGAPINTAQPGDGAAFQAQRAGAVRFAAGPYDETVVPDAPLPALAERRASSTELSRIGPILRWAALSALLLGAVIAAVIITASEPGNAPAAATKPELSPQQRSPNREQAHGLQEPMRSPAGAREPTLPAVNAAATPAPQDAAATPAPQDAAATPAPDAGPMAAPAAADAPIRRKRRSKGAASANPPDPQDQPMVKIKLGGS